VGSSTKKIIVFSLALILGIGSLAGIFVALLNDDGDTAGTASSSTSSSSTTSTTRVEFTGEGSAAFCEADARLNAAIAAQPPTSNDAASLQADYQRRVDAVNQLGQVAPAEIKADVLTIAAAYSALTPALTAAGFDMSKVPQADRAAIETPEVTSAGQRLTQYTERVCKVSQGG
jgi:hypothetical protein